MQIIWKCADLCKLVSYWIIQIFKYFLNNFKIQLTYTYWVSEKYQVYSQYLVDTSEMLLYLIISASNFYVFSA
jgi:hypothetical protein